MPCKRFGLCNDMCAGARRAHLCIAPANKLPLNGVPEVSQHLHVAETLVLVELNTLNVPLLHVLGDNVSRKVEVVALAALEELGRVRPLVVVELPGVARGEDRDDAVPVLGLCEEPGVVGDQELDRLGEAVQLFHRGGHIGVGARQVARVHVHRVL